jgi:D-alanyl-D-alanine carboxypeptidase
MKFSSLFFKRCNYVNLIREKKAFATGFFALTVALVLLLSLSNGSAQGTSYVIIDNQTGHIFSSKDMNVRRQIGSLTKIATAVVVLDAVQLKKLRLSDRVTVPPQALSAGGVNPAGLEAGDVLSLRDLLYCALMASDNVAATAIAYHVGRILPNPTGLPPVENFVAHMNALARNLRMRRTLFLNPSGIDNTQGTLPYSTAADVARLVRYAYTDPDFYFYVSQKSRVVDIERAGQMISVTLNNTNRLLGQRGIDGVKTGMTSKSGYCIVLSSWRPPEVVKMGDSVVQTPRRIIAVLLGANSSEERFSQGSMLIQTGWRMYDEWALSGRSVKEKNTL